MSTVHGQQPMPWTNQRERRPTPWPFWLKRWEKFITLPPLTHELLFWRRGAKTGHKGHILQFRLCAWDAGTGIPEDHSRHRLNNGIAFLRVQQCSTQLFMQPQWARISAYPSPCRLAFLRTRHTPGCMCIASLTDYVASRAPFPGLLSDQLPSVRSQCVPTSPGVGMWSLLSLCALGLEAFVGLRRTGAHEWARISAYPPKNLRGVFQGLAFLRTPTCAQNRKVAPNPKSGSHFCVPAKLPKKPIHEARISAYLKWEGLAFLRTPP